MEVDADLPHGVWVGGRFDLIWFDLFRILLIHIRSDDL
jgi:hypothetical protein